MEAYAVLVCDHFEELLKQEDLKAIEGRASLRQAAEPNSLRSGSGQAEEGTAGRLEAPASTEGELPLVKRGRWSNQLVRQELAPNIPAASVIKRAHLVTNRELRERENAQCIG